LVGIAEAIARRDNPAWRCRLEATIDDDEHATVMALQVAAAMAVEDLFRHGTWTPQAPEVA
jgi:hypothetical protein